MSGTTQNITVLGKRTPRHDPNDLRLVINGVSYAGWTEVEVTRGVENMPSDFDLTVTEKYPAAASLIPINPGDRCVVYMGDDRVVTGYIDRYIASVSAASHTVRITGRGKCQDLVDCSAGIVAPGTSIGGQYAATTLQALFDAIASPFGIEVNSYAATTAPTTMVPQFTINFGETPFEIIDRVSRWAGCLAYEDPYGNLTIAQVGTTQAASGFVQGVNVMSMASTRSMDERFSVYLASIMSVDNLAQLRAETGSYAFDGNYPDLGVPRFRPKVIVSEQMQNGKDFCQTRAQWEANRRWGRSFGVSVTCDTWRDSAGMLWTPNTLATLSLPSIKVTPKSPWIIGSVVFQRGEAGTSSTLTLMPAAAYNPEPQVLTAVDLQVYNAEQAAGGAAK